MQPADPATTTGQPASPPARPRYPMALRVVHASAAVVVIASALAGRMPFMWAYDTIEHRPRWSGLILLWALGTVAYLVVWHYAVRGTRVAEVFLMVAFVLGALWGGVILLISALQAFGSGIGKGVFGPSWWLRLVIAVATLVGAGALLLWQGKSGDLGDARGLALGWRGATLATALSLAALILLAYMLALVATPTTGQEQAVRDVKAAMRSGVDTRAVSPFQRSVDERVSELAHDHTRAQWGLLEGVFKASEYNPNVQWGEQLLYKEQLVCVARDVHSAAVVVLPGYCPA